MKKTLLALVLLALATSARAELIAWYAYCPNATRFGPFERMEACAWQRERIAENCRTFGRMKHPPTWFTPTYRDVCRTSTDGEQCWCAPVQYSFEQPTGQFRFTY